MLNKTCLMDLSGYLLSGLRDGRPLAKHRELLAKANSLSGYLASGGRDWLQTDATVGGVKNFMTVLLGNPFITVSDAI